MLLQRQAEKSHRLGRLVACRRAQVETMDLQRFLLLLAPAVLLLPGT